jgi:hypothetical protein
VHATHNGDTPAATATLISEKLLPQIADRATKAGNHALVEAGADNFGTEPCFASSYYVSNN